jgi:hypothetical protein
MIRVAKFRAEMASEVLEGARHNNDAIVIAACVRIRQGWLLGRKVAREDLALVEEFSL